MLVLSAISAPAIRVIPTPLPVHIVDKLVEGPFAKWGAIFAGAAAAFAGAGLIVAAIALIVAIITLNRIGEQIALAKKEIALVGQDLENNKKLIDESLRHPELCPMPQPRITLNPFRRSDQAVLSVQLMARVTNVGERVSRNIAAEWLIPPALLNESAAYPRRSVFGQEYSIVEVQFQPDIILWPNGVPTQRAPELTLIFSAQVPEATILLRFYDDAGTYPRGTWYLYWYHAETNAATPSLSTVALEPRFSLRSFS